MLGRADEEFDVVRGPQQRIERLQPTIGFLGAAGVEVIALLREDDDGFRSKGGQKVGVVEMQGEHPWRTLLGVGGKLVLEIAAKRGDEASRGGHAPALVEAAQPGGHRSAPRVAGNSHPSRVDFRSCEQVIESTNSVPGPPTAEKLADQELLIASVEVLADADPRASFCFLMTILQTFSLPDRVEDQNDVSHAAQSLGKRLVGLGRLAVVRMAARTDHSRQGEFLPLGNVKVGCDEELRTAFEDHLFNPVRVALDPRELSAHPLQIGLSMKADVDVRNGGDGARLPQLASGVGTSTAVFDSSDALADQRVQSIIAANESVAAHVAVRASTPALLAANPQAVVRPAPSLK
jgi:hypothetical protein